MQTISAGLTTLLAANQREELAQKVVVDFNSNATAAAPYGITSGDDVGGGVLGVNDDVASGWEQGFKHTLADGQALADGTWYPSEDSSAVDREYQVGWWSSQMSEGDGVFRGVSYDPYVTITYKSGGNGAVRKANILRFESSSTLPYISKIKVYLNTGSGFDAGTEYTLTTWYTEIDLGSVLELTQVKVVAMETSEATQHARFMQIDPIWRVTFTDSDIDVLRVIKRMEHLVTTRLPYGSFAASELDLELLDDDDNFKGTGAYVAYMVPNVKITAYFGALVGASYEWVQQGIFYTEDTWSFTPGLSVRVTARDRMKCLQEMPMPATLAQGMTGGQLFYNLAHRAHIRPGLVDAEALATVYTYAVFDEGTLFDAMSELAMGAQAIFYFDELGVLQVNNSAHSYGASIDTLTDADWTEEPKVEEPERANKVTVKYSQFTAAPPQEVYSTGPDYSLAVAASSSKTIIGDFNKGPVKRISSVALTAGADISLTQVWQDGFTFRMIVDNSGGSPENVTAISIIGYPVAVKDDCKATASDADLIRRWGLREYELELTVPISSANAATLATNVLAKLKGAKRVLSWAMQSRYQWQLGDVVSVDSERMGIDDVDYYINEIALSKHKMTCELVGT